jgi:hypothetical protein
MKINQIQLSSLVGIMMMLGSCSGENAQTVAQSVTTSGAVVYFVGYDANGYQKLFKSDKGVVSQVADFNPGANDNIGSLWVVRESLFVMTCFSTCSLYVVNGATPSLLERGFSGQAFSTSAKFVYVTSTSPYQIVQYDPQTQISQTLLSSTGWVGWLTGQKQGHYYYFQFSSSSGTQFFSYDVDSDQGGQVTGFPSGYQNWGTYADPTLSVVALRVYVNGSEGVYLVNGLNATSDLGSEESSPQFLGNNNVGIILYTVITSSKRDLKIITNTGSQKVISAKENIYITRWTSNGAYVETILGGQYECFHVTAAGAQSLGNQSCSNY